MKDKILTTIRSFRLLTPCRTGPFVANVVAARKEHGRDNRKHLLHEQIVYSFLAYRARIDSGASLAEISRETTLHKNSVRNALDGLCDVVYKHDGLWIANKPPKEWFTEDPHGGHWSDKLRYTKFYPPRKRAAIGSRRFTLNHALVFSLVVSFTRKQNPTYELSFSYLSKLLQNMNRKTISKVMGDLVAMGIVTCEQQGARLIVKRMPLSQEHLGLFQPRSIDVNQWKPKASEPERPTCNEYDLKADGFDNHRKACEKLMPQSYAEQAIIKSRKLGICLGDFKGHLQDAKSVSDGNLKSGKCAYPNLGKYFVNRLDSLLTEHERITEEAEKERRLHEYVNSDAYKKERALQMQRAKAEPMHPEAFIDQEAILARVRFSEKTVSNILQYDKITKKLHHHCSGFARSRGAVGQAESDVTGNLKQRILKQALSTLNDHYESDTFATADEFKTAIDSAIDRINGMNPLFAKAEEVCHA